MSSSTSSIPEPKEAISLKVIILSGRSGSGKSSTAYEMCHMLHLNKLMHLHIDGDNLDTLYPLDQHSDLAMQNLEAIWARYWIAAGRQWAGRNETEMSKKELVVIISGTAMVLDAARIREILEKGVISNSPQTQLDAQLVVMSTYLVVLETRTDIIRQRLEQREIGGELDAHLKSSDRMADVLSTWKTEQPTAVVAIDSSACDVREVATEVLVNCNLELM